MVTTVAVSDVAQELNGSVPTPEQPTNGAASSRPMICPRCDARLRINYFEPQCLQCGYVDYAYVPERPAHRRKNMVGAGTQYILRYIGDFPYLAETLAYVKLERLRNRVVFGVKCPFCDRAMEQSSLSGRRRELREERYKCTEGHRVSLTPTQSGALGWK